MSLAGDLGEFIGKNLIYIAMGLGSMYYLFKKDKKENKES